MKLGVLLLLAVSVAHASAMHRPGEMAVETVSLKTPQGSVVSYEQGTLYVRENRLDPASRVIGIGFARFRALQPTGAPPTFHLPGGPGQSFLPWLDPASPRFARLMSDVELYRQVSDVVFIDQRGFSPRGDVFAPEQRALDLPPNHAGNLARETAATAAFARDSVARLTHAGVDLRAYTVKDFAADVDELRSALGYDRITLIGQSFGSQWSFAVMRLYPNSVARAVISGVEPLNHGYDMPSHVLAALHRQWYEAEKDPRLKPWLPQNGLAFAAQTILERLRRKPVSVTVSNDKTGDKVTVVLGAEDFQRDLLNLANPASLLSLYYAHYEDWARDVLRRRQGVPDADAVIRPLVDTSIGVTAAREYLLRTDPALDVLGRWNFDSDLASADIWPTPDIGDELRTEVLSCIPVVFIEGDWDVWTPMENLLQVVPYYVASRTLIVEHGTHFAYSELRRQRPQVTAAIMDFLRSGETTNLPVRVSIDPPELSLPAFPPPKAPSE